jgi:hypothetical protein
MSLGIIPEPSEVDLNKVLAVIEGQPLTEHQKHKRHSHPTNFLYRGAQVRLADTDGCLQRRFLHSNRDDVKVVKQRVRPFSGIITLGQKRYSARATTYQVAKFIFPCIRTTATVNLSRPHNDLCQG